MKEVKELQRQLIDAQFELTTILNESHDLLTEAVPIEHPLGTKINCVIQGTIEVITHLQTQIKSILDVTNSFEYKDLSINALTLASEDIKQFVEALDMAVSSCYITEREAQKMWEDGMTVRKAINVLPQPTD